MNINVETDRTDRSLFLRITGAEPMARSHQEYRRNQVTFQPDAVHIRATGGGLASVALSGPVLKKDGQPHASRRDSESWYSRQSFEREAPAWLIQVVAEALAGVTGWTGVTGASRTVSP